jgi:regulator of protease activity HflC (stomatin/prohibitin superfamily)
VVVLIVLLGITALVLGTSLRIVPSSPPYMAIVTFFGRPTKMIKRSGLGFFLFYPHIMGEILIPLSLRTIDLSTLELMSSDSARVKFQVHLTWAPVEAYPDVLVYADLFIKGGPGPTQVEAALRERFLQQLRPWAMSTDWRGMSSESACASFAQDCLARFNPDTVAVHEFLGGSAPLRIPSLGIVLHRLNLTDVRYSDDLIRAAEKLPLKIETLKPETLGLLTFNDWIKKTMTDLGCSYAEAADLIQTQLGVVPKTITRTQVSLDVLSSDQLATLLEWVSNRPRPGQHQ